MLNAWSDPAVYDPWLECRGPRSMSLVRQVPISRSELPSALLPPSSYMHRTHRQRHASRICIAVCRRTAEIPVLIPFTFRMHNTLRRAVSKYSALS